MTVKEWEEYVVEEKTKNEEKEGKAKSLGNSEENEA